MAAISHSTGAPAARAECGRDTRARFPLHVDHQTPLVRAGPRVAASRRGRGPSRRRRCPDPSQSTAHRAGTLGSVPRHGSGDTDRSPRSRPRSARAARTATHWHRHRSTLDACGEFRTHAPCRCRSELSRRQHRMRRDAGRDHGDVPHPRQLTRAVSQMARQHLTPFRSVVAHSRASIMAHPAAGHRLEPRAGYRIRR
jgi:hypothetical protein